MFVKPLSLSLCHSLALSLAPTLSPLLSSLSPDLSFFLSPRLNLFTSPSTIHGTSKQNFKKKLMLMRIYAIKGLDKSHVKPKNNSIKSFTKIKIYHTFTNNFPKVIQKSTKKSPKFIGNFLKIFNLN